MTSDLLLYILRFVCTVKSDSILHLSFSIITSGLCSFQFSFSSVPYFLHISQWIFVPNQSIMSSFISFFWANLLHLLNPSFTLSSAFPQILHLQFSWVLSIFTFMLLVLIACSCGHHQGFSCSF